jgi:3-dehydroquinate synthase
VNIHPGLLNHDDPTLARAGSTQTRRRLIVIDSNVNTIYGGPVRRYFAAHKIAHEFCVINAHERDKTMDSVFRIVAAMEKFGVVRRREPVVAIGGGVLTDLVGLAASLYRRSTPYVRVPTTLIGMIDAGIGAKTGVNFQQHKNRLGSYHPSAVTLVDPGFLGTLSLRHIRNGLAEALKLGLIKDAELFELLAAHGSRLVAERLQTVSSADHGAAAGAVLRRSILGMLQELEANLWEHELQRLVDYGHSFSPTIEMAALPDLLHGEAVAIDMSLSVVVANSRGMLDDADLGRVLAVVRDLELPMRHPVCTAELLATALADTVKHRDGDQHIPLTAGLGSAEFVNDLSAVELENALQVLGRKAGDGNG